MQSCSCSIALLLCSTATSLASLSAKGPPTQGAALTTRAWPLAAGLTKCKEHDAAHRRPCSDIHPARKQSPMTCIPTLCMLQGCRRQTPQTIPPTALCAALAVRNKAIRPAHLSMHCTLAVIRISCCCKHILMTIRNSHAVCITTSQSKGIRRDTRIQKACAPKSCEACRACSSPAPS